MHHITIRDQVCNVMASLTKTFFVRPEIVLQNLEAITACRLSQLLHAIQHGRVHWHCAAKQWVRAVQARCASEKYVWIASSKSLSWK